MSLFCDLKPVVQPLPIYLRYDLYLGHMNEATMREIIRLHKKADDDKKHAG
jgi:hypothetical protein